MEIEILEELGLFLGSESVFDTSNETDKCSNSDYFYTSVNIINIILFVMGFIGNTATIVSVLCCRTLRKPTYILVASLSVADLCCLLFNRLGRSYDVVKDFLPFEVYISVGMTLYYVSTAHVIALSVFRLQMMKNPLEFEHSLSKRRILIYITVCYLVGIVFGSIEYIIFTQDSVKHNLTGILVCLAVMETVIPQVTLLTIHLIKVGVLRNSALSNFHVTPHIRTLSKMTCIIILTNVVTILPLWIGVITLRLVKDQDKVSIISCYYITAAVIFIILHHSINPVIFFFVSKPYQKLTCRSGVCVK